MLDDILLKPVDLVIIVGPDPLHFEHGLVVSLDVGSTLLGNVSIEDDKVMLWSCSSLASVLSYRAQTNHGSLMLC